MPESLSPQSQMRPLSPGNIVNAAVWLYRSHLKLYSQLALNAHLWLLVPIYGWAKYSAILGLISRLAFNELINQPENISNSRSFVNKRMWQFFWAGILVTLRLTLSFFCLYILITLVGVILFVGFYSLRIYLINQITLRVLNFILSLITVAVFVIALIRIYAQYVIVELPLAVEDNLNANQAIKRSIDLSKKQFKQLQTVWTIGVILSIVIQLLVQIPVSIISRIINNNLESNLAVYHQINFLLSLGSGLLVGVIITPVWQAIKAALYYDMRLRQEALGFHLPERSDRL